MSDNATQVGTDILVIYFKKSLTSAVFKFLCTGPLYLKPSSVSLWISRLNCWNAHNKCSQAKLCHMSAQTN